MLSNINVLKFHHYYFSGVGGISMSGLAKYLISIGKKVYGSDIVSNNLTDELEFLGVKIDFTQTGEYLNKDCVFVYSSAISNDNVEFIKAKSLGLTLIKRSELLGAICSQFETFIAVSGSHGKTTTTAMIAQILLSGKYEPTIFLGGEYFNYGNFYNGKGKIVLAEACEYKKNFLYLKPSISGVLNIDNDHLDSYAGLHDEIDTFEKFIKGSISVVNADDANASRVFSTSKISFGINSPANFVAKRITQTQNGISFSVYQSGILMGRVNLKIKGKHNVYNALCAISICSIIKTPFKIIKKGLEAFVGVKRRNELLFSNDKIEIYADYAHHPSEIESLLQMYDKEKTLFIFQPHTFSRTQILMNEFVEVLSQCKNLIIYKTYPARERYNYKGSALKLYCNLPNDKIINLGFFNDEEKLKKHLYSSINKYKKIIFIGAGDIYEIAQKTARLIK